MIQVHNTLPTRPGLYVALWHFPQYQDVYDGVSGEKQHLGIFCHQIAVKQDGSVWRRQDHTTSFYDSWIRQDISRLPPNTIFLSNYAQPDESTTTRETEDLARGEQEAQRRERTAEADREIFQRHYRAAFRNAIHRATSPEQGEGADGRSPYSHWERIGEGADGISDPNDVEQTSRD